MIISIVTNFFLNKLFVLAIDSIAVFLALLVFKDNFKGKANRIYLITTVLMISWVTFAYIPRLIGQTSHDIALILLRIAWFATPLFFASLYLLGVCLINEERKYKNLSRIVAGAGIGLSLAAGFSKTVIAGFQFMEFGIIRINYGSSTIPFLAGISFLIGATIFPLLKERAILGNRKIQYFAVGLVIFYTFNAIFNIALPMFWDISRFYFLGDYSTLILLSFIAYAIVKHRLFEIKIFITELLVVSIWAFGLIRALLAETLKEGIINGAFLALLIIFGILLIRAVSDEIRQKEEIKKLSAYKSELLSIVSHQIKNPLAIVKGYASLINDKTISDPRAVEETAKKIKAAADKLLKILNNLLDFHHIEEGKMHYEFQRLGLNDLLKNVVNDFQIVAKQKGLDFVFESAPSEIYVNADIYKLSQVFQNLIDNSIKYTDSGWVKVKIENANPGADASVLIIVSDSGRGMNRDLSGRLFEKFQRGVKEKEILGTGLGLYICKEIVQAHQGAVWAESEGEGKGSKFFVRLKTTE